MGDGVGGGCGGIVSARVEGGGAGGSECGSDVLRGG